MGLGDIVSKILMEVKADVSDAKRGLKDLQGEEKKLAEQRIAGMEAGNASIDKYVKGLGQIGIALGAVKVGMDAFEKYAHRLDLQATTAGVNIERLSKAALGLKTNSELLEHAAALRSGTFKLEQGQLETVEKAMFVLEERGKSSSEVWSAMEAALTKGSIKPLQSLGVVINDTGHLFDENGEKLTSYGKRQEALSLIMKELAGVSKEAEGAQLDQADAMSVQITRLKNQWEDVQLKLGEIVATVGGPLMNALASAIERTMKLIDVLPKGPGGKSWLTFMPGIEGWNAAMGELDEADKVVFGSNRTGSAAAGGFRAALSRYQTEQESRPDYPGAQLEGIESGVDRGRLATWFEKHGFNLSESDRKKLADEALTMAAQAILDGAKGGGGNYVRGGISIGGFKSGLGLGSIGGAGIGGAADSSYRDEFGADISLQSIIDNVNKEQNTALTKDWFARLQAQQSKKQNFLESTFGPVDQFNLYAQSFQMLGGAVTTAMDAWIDGSVSAGEAVKKFIGQALKGLASQMAVESLKHGAYAIGSLAFGDVAGASTHAAAAAAFGAGAAAAAVAARAMGGGASAGAGGGEKLGKVSAFGGGNGGSSGGGSGSGGGGGQNQYIIVYGEPFVSESNRMRQLDAEKLVRKAIGSSAAENR